MRSMVSRLALLCAAALTLSAVGAPLAAQEKPGVAPAVAPAAKPGEVGGAGTIGAKDLEELIRQADRVTRGDTSAAVVEMQIKTADYDRTYSMVIWDDSRGTAKALVKILGPAIWRGNGTLKVGDRLLMYNPRNDHVTVVGSSMLGDSWMGSHLTNDDLVKETSLADDYEAQLVRQWQAEAPTGGGEATWYDVKLTPRPRAPVVWGRISVTFFRKGDLVIPTKMVYFREDAPDAAPVRTMALSDIEELGGRIVPKTMRIEVTDKPGEFTELRHEKLRFDIDIPADKFTERALRQ